MKAYVGIKVIASKVREQLKKEFPKCGFSVTIQRYSMGQSLDVSLMSAPFDVLTQNNDRYYAQLNQYQLKGDYTDGGTSNGALLTEKAWSLLCRVNQIIKKYHRDESDIQTDYFNCNFYYHLNIGKWDKPFTIK